MSESGEAMVSWSTDAVAADISNQINNMDSLVRTSDLHLNNVNISYCGTYTCTFQGTQNVSASTSLIISKLYLIASYYRYVHVFTTIHTYLARYIV